VAARGEGESTNQNMIPAPNRKQCATPLPLSKYPRDVIDAGLLRGRRLLTTGATLRVIGVSTSSRLSVRPARQQRGKAAHQAVAPPLQITAPRNNLAADPATTKRAYTSQDAPSPPACPADSPNPFTAPICTPYHPLGANPVTNAARPNTRPANRPSAPRRSGAQQPKAAWRAPKNMKHETAALGRGPAKWANVTLLARKKGTHHARLPREVGGDFGLGRNESESE